MIESENKLTKAISKFTNQDIQENLASNRVKVPRKRKEMVLNINVKSSSNEKNSLDLKTFNSTKISTLKFDQFNESTRSHTAEREFKENHDESNHSNNNNRRRCSEIIYKNNKNSKLFTRSNERNVSIAQNKSSHIKASAISVDETTRLKKNNFNLDSKEPSDSHKKNTSHVSTSLSQIHHSVITYISSPRPSTNKKPHSGQSLQSPKSNLKSSKNIVACPKRKKNLPSYNMGVRQSLPNFLKPGQFSQDLSQIFYKNKNIFDPKSPIPQTTNISRIGSNANNSPNRANLKKAKLSMTNLHKNKPEIKSLLNYSSLVSKPANVYSKSAMVTPRTTCITKTLTEIDSEYLTETFRKSIKEISAKSPSPSIQENKRGAFSFKIPKNKPQFYSLQHSPQSKQTKSIKLPIVTDYKISAEHSIKLNKIHKRSKSDLTSWSSDNAKKIEITNTQKNPVVEAVNEMNFINSQDLFQSNRLLTDDEKKNMLDMSIKSILNLIKKREMELSNNNIEDSVNQNKSYSERSMYNNTTPPKSRDKNSFITHRIQTLLENNNQSENKIPQSLGKNLILEKKPESFRFCPKPLENIEEVTEVFSPKKNQAQISIIENEFSPKKIVRCNSAPSDLEKQFIQARLHQQENENILSSFDEFEEAKSYEFFNSKILNMQRHIDTLVMDESYEINDMSEDISDKKCQNLFLANFK